MPVPPIDQQPALVNELDSLRDSEREIAKLHDRAEELMKALMPASLNAAFAKLA
ncbi:MAG: hypothetical protein KDB71_13660 [Mycobacterium sp.]|nr:hypothetical protein [Mycobacterium sp.]